MVQMRCFVAGLAVLGLLSGAPLHCESAAPDWITPGDAAYPLLLRGAREAGVKDWAASVLASGMSLPQATARVLAQSLERSPAVEESLKIQLETLLPDEPLALPGLDSEIDAAQQRLDKLKAGLADVTQSMAHNNYSPTSNPTAWLTYTGYERYLDAKGVAAENFSQNPMLLNAELRGVGSVGTYDITLIAQSDVQDQANNRLTQPYVGASPSVSLLGNPFGIQSVTTTLGLMSLKLSKLIFAAPAYPYQNPFFQDDAALASMHVEAPGGERNIQGLYLRKQGAQGWWIFSDAQAFLAPESEFYREFNRRHGYEAAVRLDLPPMGGIPFTQSTQFYTTYYFYGNDPGQLPTFFDNEQFYQQPTFQEYSNNVALGWQSELDGGGTLSGEVAQASWTAIRVPVYPALGNSTLSDQAGVLDFSKPIGRTMLGIQASQIGPRFVPGGQDFAYGGTGNNDAGSDSSGMQIDTLLARDPRNGNVDTSWNTVSEDPSWLTNNSDRVAVTLSWLGSVSNVNFTMATSRQMQASGPWVTGAPYFNNSPYNGYGYSQLFFDNYSDFPTNASGTSGPDSQGVANASYFNYNNTTTAPAYYGAKTVAAPDGQQVTGPLNPAGYAKWDDLEQLNWRNVSDTIWLSQNGVGDEYLMPDSIKYYNTLHLDWTLDGGALFHTSGNMHLTLTGEIRDTAQDPRIPIGVPSDLLMQQLIGADLVCQLGPDWQLLGTCGHEAWTTDHSYYPVNFADNTVGLGLDALLNEMADGLKLDMRLEELDHEDYVFASRSFTGWQASLGFTYAYKD